MDKKDDNKKPSKKDKKKKDKKNQVKKINKSQIVKQSVNIKIGDLSKPRTRRRAAPKAPPPPPQIQRQLQYLPSLAGQAPLIPPPLAPAPPPAPAPRPPPAPAEPRRTGDFFSDDTSSGFGSRFGTSYDLASAPGELELLGTLSRSSSRPTLSQTMRSRSNSEISLLTDFTGGSESIDLENVSFLSDATYQEPTPSISTQPEALGAGADFENIAAPSVVNIADNLGFVSSQQPQQIQELQPIQTPPEAQPIEAELVQEPVVAVPVIEDPMISEPLQAQAIKGDVRPEDEATGGGGGGKKESIIFSELSDKKLSRLFKIFENERIPMQLTQADAIERYNLIKKTGGLISTKQFSLAYTKYKKQRAAAEEE